MKKTDSMLAPKLGEQCLGRGQWGVSDLLVMANFLIGVIVTQMLFFVNICQFLHLQFLLFVYVYYIELNISLKIIKKQKTKNEACRALQGNWVFSLWDHRVSRSGFTLWTTASSEDAGRRLPAFFFEHSSNNMKTRSNSTLVRTEQGGLQLQIALWVSSLPGWLVSYIIHD